MRASALGVGGRGDKEGPCQCVGWYNKVMSRPLFLNVKTRKKDMDG